LHLCKFLHQKKGLVLPNFDNFSYKPHILQGAIWDGSLAKKQKVNIMAENNCKALNQCFYSANVFPKMRKLSVSWSFWFCLILHQVPIDCQQYKRILKFFSIHCFYSQIWLHSLMDDHHSSTQNWKKSNKK